MKGSAKEKVRKKLVHKNKLLCSKTFPKPIFKPYFPQNAIPCRFFIRIYYYLHGSKGAHTQYNNKKLFKIS